MAKASLQKLIWASLDDYLPPGMGGQYVGRLVANHTFFQALLKYSHFDEYHFFLANKIQQRLFESRHGAFLEELGVRHKVKLFDILELPEQVRQCDYTVFHQSDHLGSFNSLCHFRNQTASFPATAFIHSVSYIPGIMNKYLELMFGGVTSGDALICSSVSGKKVLEKCFQQIATRLNLSEPTVQMEVIPLGIDGDRFPELDRIGCRKQLGLDETEVIGLCLGRFSEYDKMDLLPLLLAFKKIYRKGCPWRLVLAGAVQSEAYLKILEAWARGLGIVNNMTFITNLSETDKVALYRAADFFISLSDNPQETFGLTLLEAMACGLPLVVSDFDGYREIVTDEIGRRIRTTWSNFEPLVTLGPLMDMATYHRYLAQSICLDVDQLVDTLKFFFLNPAPAREMGKAARRRFLTLYDCRVVIPRLEELWLKLKENFNSPISPSHSDPLAMNVFDCFSHYVSQTLTPDTIIKLTDYGQIFLESGANYPLLPGMENLIDQKDMRRIMEQARDSVQVVDVDGMEDWKKRYLVLWMLKQGLLGVVSSREGRGKMEEG
ncbi:MAG: glycosyltransferase family 4 protein [candidate division KSB1 bacterium]|nr:glycosyltransferase family 4 protein [candidate division KSB1 bacterium]